MKSIKKWLSLALATLMVLVVLAGCASGTENDTPVQTPTPDTTGEPVKPDETEDPFAKYQPIEGKEYSFTWTAGQLGPVDPDGEMTQYWEEKWGVDLDVWNIDSTQWDEIMNLKFSSGEIPDKIRINNFTTFQKYYNQDLLAEIPEDVLKHFAPTLYELHTTDVPGALNYGKIDGALYGIANYSISGNYRVPTVYRGDWLKNVGIDKTPETLDEFEEAMYAFANNDPDGNGKKDTYGLSTTGINSVYGAYGYLPDRWSDRDGKLVFGAVQPEMKEALAKLAQWYKDGVIDPEFITGENKGGYALVSHAFTMGQIGYSSLGQYYHWRPKMTDTDADVIGQNIQELEKTNPEVIEHLVHGKPPVGPTGKSGVAQGSIVTGIFDSLGKPMEEEPDRIGKMLMMWEDLVKSFDNFIIARQGIEGEHWEWQNDMPVRVEPYTDGKELSKIGAMPIMTLFTPYEYESKLLPLRIQFAEENHFAEGGIRNELLTTLESQAKYQTELDKIREETFVSIIIGDKPVDYFDTFVENWYKSGGSELEAEANEWYQSIEK
jgi:putative aldouronate transport system substrate-binding protein